MKTSRNRGFTLLELLIVLVIVGVLTTIVLVATSSARKKGGDAGVKSNLHTIRNQAAIFFTNNNNFGATYDGNSGGGGPGDECPSYNNITGESMFRVDKIIVNAITKATDDGSGSNWCYNSSVWAVAVSLKSNPAYSWCVDSSGKAKQVNSVPGAAINATTHLCNP